MYRQGHAGLPEEDPSRAEEKSGHRSWQNSASEAQGAGRPQDGVRLVKAARQQRGGEPRERGPCPPQGELGLELGSAGPSPRALPTGTSLCLKTKRLHE